MLRWGLIGTGIICDQFARDLHAVENGFGYSVASRNLEKAKQFAADHNIEKAYGNYEEMLADPNIDVIYVGTPHTEHLKHASDALRAGKHVLCEKPLTVFPKESEELFKVQKETGNYLMEAMWTWFLPAVRKAQQWVKEGRIGELKHIKADFGYPQAYDTKGRMYNPDLAGGCLLDMGIYPIALAWLFDPTYPDDIFVKARTAPNGVDDDIVMVFDYADHVATLASSFRCKLQNWAYIIGTEGYIAIPDFWRAKDAMLYKLDDCVEHYKDERTHLGFAHEAYAVGEDILAGRTSSEVVSLRDSMAFQMIMDQIRQYIPK